MNFHPLLVHFPIALLTVYALFELVPIKRVREYPHWFTVKATILIIGTLGLFAAYIAGNAQEDSYATTANAAHMLQVHSTWATLTGGIFVILAAVYLIEWVRLSGYRPKHASMARILLIKEHVATFLFNSGVVAVLALGGLIALTITGALGGALVYGTNVDPFVSLVTKWLY